MLLAVPEGRKHATAHGATRGRPGVVRRQEQERGEGLGCSPSWGFHTEERRGRADSAGLVRLNKSSGLWGTGAVPSCLVPGPGLILGKGNAGLVCESKLKE